MYIIRQPIQLKCYSQASTQLNWKYGHRLSLAALAHREEEPTIKYRQYENGSGCGIAPCNAIRFADYFLQLRMLCILVVKWYLSARTGKHLKKINVHYLTVLAFACILCLIWITKSLNFLMIPCIYQPKIFEIPINTPLTWSSSKLTKNLVMIPGGICILML